MNKIFFIFLLVCLLSASCVLPPSPTVVSFTVSPSTITAGQSATLTWTVNNASLVRIDLFSGNQYPNGSTVVSPPATTTYVLIASNAGGSVTATAMLTVNPSVEVNPSGEATPTSYIPVVNIFALNPSTISAGDSSTLQWDVTGATSVFIEPSIGYVPLSGSQLVSPTSSVNYVLTASNAGNTVTSSATLNVNLYPPYGSANPLPSTSASFGLLPLINFFDINPPVIDKGSSTTIEWNVSNADIVFIDHGIGNVTPLGTMTISPSTNTVYTLTASSLYGSTTSEATVVVSPPSGAPAILSFSATPNSITLGGTSTLHWNVTGATSVTIDQGIGSVPLSGTQSVSPSATTTYTITATNSSGSVVASTTVTETTTAGQPVVVSFISNPSSITPGQSSMLLWNVTGATSVSINQGVDTVPLSGTQLVSPASTTAYTITATNATGSVSASTTVILVPPTQVPVIPRFSIYPTSIKPGGSATLQWQIGGATTISVDQGIGAVAPSGELQVSPASTKTYTLTATNSGGSTTASVTLTVIPDTGRPYIYLFSATPQVISYGGATTLQWQVTGATSISITPGLGSVPATGTRVVTPNETTVYILTATNNVGVTAHTAQVSVTFEPK